MFEFACPSCGQRFTVDDSFAGQQGICDNCETVVQIPQTMPVQHLDPLSFQQIPPADHATAPAGQDSTDGTESVADRLRGKRNVGSKNRRVYWYTATALAVASIAAVACYLSLSQSILGKWYEIGGTGTIEFFDDGTVIAGTSDTALTQTGRYALLDGGRMTLEFGGILALAGTRTVKQEVSLGVLTLTNSNGKITRFQRDNSRASRPRKSRTVKRSEPNAAFDPASFVRTRAWVDKHADSIVELRKQGNEVAYAESLKSVKAAFDRVVGRGVEWTLHVALVTRNGVAFKEASSGLIGMGRSVGVRFTKQPQFPTENMRALRADDPLKIRAQIVGVDLSLFPERTVFTLDTTQHGRSTTPVRSQDSRTTTSVRKRPKIQSGQIQRAVDQAKVAAAKGDQAASKANWPVAIGAFESSIEQIDIAIDFQPTNESWTALREECQKKLTAAKCQFTLEQAKTAFEAGKFDEAYQAATTALNIHPSDKVAKQLKNDSQFAKGIHDGELALKSNDHAEAIRLFVEALNAKPSDPIAIERLQQAKAAAGYRSVPFTEDFADTTSGGLPDGWKGDEVIGVKRTQTDAWLEASRSGTHRVSTPPLIFPKEFELTFVLWTFEGADVRMHVNDFSGAPIVKTLFEAQSFRTTFGFENQQTQSLRERAFRVRLVRDSKLFRLIVGDQIAMTQAAVPSEKIASLTFHLEGGSRVSNLVSLSLDRHFKDIPKPAKTTLAEVFSTAKEGTLPDGWTGSSAVAVKNLDATTSYLQGPTSGTHWVQSPDFKVPENFVLEAEARLNGSELQIALVGAGNSGDLIMRFDPTGFRNDKLKAQFTGVDETTVPSMTITKIRFERDGEIHRLSLNGRAFDRSIRMNPGTYRRLAIGFQGNREPDRIFKIAVRPLSQQEKPSTPPGKTPSPKSAPEAVSTLGPATGVWQRWDSEGRTDGTLLKFVQRGDELHIGLHGGEGLRFATGLLKPSSQSSFDWSGDWTVVFPRDPKQAKRSLKMQVRIVDENKMYVKSERVKWDRTGNEIKREDFRYYFKRVGEKEGESTE